MSNDVCFLVATNIINVIQLSAPQKKSFGNDNSRRKKRKKIHTNKNLGDKRYWQDATASLWWWVSLDNMLALMRKTFWSHFWSEKSNNNLVYCPSSPPFNDHAAATSVRGILNGPQNQKLPSKNGHSTSVRKISQFCPSSWWRLTAFCTFFQLNFWVDSGDLSPLYSQ